MLMEKKEFWRECLNNPLQKMVPTGGISVVEQVPLLQKGVLVYTFGQKRINAIELSMLQFQNWVFQPQHGMAYDGNSRTYGYFRYCD